MPAIQLPEPEILQLFSEKDADGFWKYNVFDLADRYGVSERPIRRILQKHNAARTQVDSLRLSRKVKAKARERCDRFRPNLTGQDARDCRMDAGWEARHGIADVVYCRECSIGFFELSVDGTDGDKARRGHIWVAHGLTGETYKRKWPGARLTSFRHQAKCDKSNNNPGDHMENFAAKYVTAEQLRQCRNDVEWEKKHRIRKRTVCRDCGRIGGLSLFNHLRDVHGWDRKQYRASYPKAPMRSIAMLERIRAKLVGVAAGQEPRIFIDNVNKALASPESHPWMSPNEVAQALGISRATFYRTADSFKHLRRGAKGTYSTASVVRQIEKGC